MSARRTATLPPAEAHALHHQALVIDTPRPPITRAVVCTARMQRPLEDLMRRILRVDTRAWATGRTGD